MNLMLNCEWGSCNVKVYVTSFSTVSHMDHYGQDAQHFHQLPRKLAGVANNDTLQAKDIKTADTRPTRSPAKTASTGVHTSSLFMQAWTTESNLAKLLLLSKLTFCGPPLHKKATYIRFHKIYVSGQGCASYCFEMHKTYSVISCYCMRIFIACPWH